MKEVALIHKTNDFSKLFREELEHYSRFWSDVGKYKMELLKKRKKKENFATEPTILIRKKIWWGSS